MKSVSRRKFRRGRIAGLATIRWLAAVFGVEDCDYQSFKGQVYMRCARLGVRAADLPPRELGLFLEEYYEKRKILDAGIDAYVFGGLQGED